MNDRGRVMGIKFQSHLLEIGESLHHENHLLHQFVGIDGGLYFVHAVSEILQSRSNFRPTPDLGLYGVQYFREFFVVRKGSITA